VDTARKKLKVVDNHIITQKYRIYTATGRNVPTPGISYNDFANAICMNLFIGFGLPSLRVFTL
jgi:hypothetical protein